MSTQTAALFSVADAMAAAPPVRSSEHRCEGCGHGCGTTEHHARCHPVGHGVCPDAHPCNACSARACCTDDPDHAGECRWRCDCGRWMRGPIAGQCPDRGGAGVHIEPPASFLRAVAIVREGRWME